MSEVAINPRELRRALGSFPTGVTIVSTVDESGTPWGFTANSFTSVSLDPPLVLICVAKTAGSCPVFAGSGRFAVNILADEQREISMLFATPGQDRFSSISWSTRATGSPIIDGVVAWLDCVTHSQLEVGDHWVLFGRVVAYAHSAEPPLGYCRGAYFSFAVTQDALDAAEGGGGVRVGAIVEADRAVLFDECRSSEDLQLPSGSRLGASTEQGTLLGRLAGDGIEVDRPFLFAVYDDAKTHHLFYRAEVRTLSGDKLERARCGSRFLPFGEIPWGRIADPAEKTMLERYIREREADAFGIYVGDAASGSLHSAV
jgi:flavin reductase (DIM6/NTAB) family NADH-FMN oxidoreductase RutF